MARTGTSGAGVPVTGARQFAKLGLVGLGAPLVILACPFPGRTRTAADPRVAAGSLAWGSVPEPDSSGLA
jgi:hypothetical protein